MVNIFLAISSLVLLCAQLIYPRLLSLFGIRPDFLLIIIIFLSLYSRHMRIFFWAALLGGVKDLISADLFGMYLLTYTCIAVGLSVFEARFFLREKLSSLALFIFSVVLLTGLFEQLVHVLFGTGVYSSLGVILVVFLQAVLTTAWALPIMHTLTKCALKFSIFQ
jgi:rod shape-determining protein MreD